MLLKHAGLFFLADDEHRAVGLEKETRSRRRGGVRKGERGWRWAEILWRYKRAYTMKQSA